MRICYDAEVIRGDSAGIEDLQLLPRFISIAPYRFRVAVVGLIGYGVQENAYCN